MYKVIKAFHDLQDFKSTKSGMFFHEYNVGDEYPRAGVKVTEERIAELAGCYNAQGTPLIEEVYNGTAVDPTKMKREELIAFAEEQGIEINPKAKKETILDQIMTGAAKDGDHCAE